MPNPTHIEPEPVDALQQELRLIEQETGIVLNPAAPIAGFVRAAATTGNERAQRLLARMKAALHPAL